MQEADNHEKAEPNDRGEPESTLDRIDATLDSVDDALGSIDDSDGVDSQVQQLTWALVDEQISEPEIRQLEKLLIDDERARHVYVQCIQLHTDLIYFFAEQRAKDDPSSSGLPFPLPQELRDLLAKNKPTDPSEPDQGDVTECRGIRSKTLSGIVADCRRVVRRIVDTFNPLFPGGSCRIRA